MKDRKIMEAISNLPKDVLESVLYDVILEVPIRDIIKNEKAMAKDAVETCNKFMSSGHPLAELSTVSTLSRWCDTYDNLTYLQARLNKRR